MSSPNSLAHVYGPASTRWLYKRNLELPIEVNVFDLRNNNAYFWHKGLAHRCSDRHIFASKSEAKNAMFDDLSSEMKTLWGKAMELNEL